MPKSQPAGSDEYVLIPVQAELPIGTAYDPTSDSVSMAFMSSDSAVPGSSDWKVASWETAATTPPTYYARCLVGPGGTVTLATGNWWVWVKVTDNPEVPESGPIDILTIY